MVYDDRLLIGMTGGPSTGKSTLSEAIVDKIGGSVVEEQLKWYWEENHQNRELTDEQLIEVAELQIDAENDVHDDIVVSDTTPITAEAYARYYHGDASSALTELSGDCKDRYDLVVLCDTDIPFEDDGVRSGDATRQEIQQHTISILEREDVDYILVNGTVEERLNCVVEYLDI